MGPLLTDAQDLHLVMAALITAWVVYDLASLREGEGGRSLWVGVAALAVGEWVRAPLVYDRVEGALGPGWGTVLYHVACVGVGLGAVDLLQLLLGRPLRARVLSAAVGVAAVVGAVVPWLVAPPAAVPAQLGGRNEFYDSSWQSAVHWATVLGYLLWATGTSARYCTRDARAAGPGPLRTGMRLVATGTLLGMVCLVGHVVIAGAWLSGHTGTWLTSADTDARWDALTLGPAVAILASGTAWAKISDLWSRRRQERALRRRVQVLRPHWAALVEQMPEVSPFARVLHEPGGDYEQLELQQTRMVVETYDVMRRVMPYVSGEDQSLIAKKVHLAGLRGQVARASGEYIALQVGIRRRAASARRCAGAREPRVPAVTAVGAAEHIAADLRRVNRRRARGVITAILEEETLP